MIFENSNTWDFDGGTTADLKSSTGFLLGFGYHYTDQLEFGGDLEFDNQGYARLSTQARLPDWCFRSAAIRTIFG
ncbi:MAG: hypothetical protein ABI616_06570 [Pseudomonadota bacterium]